MGEDSETGTDEEQGREEGLGEVGMTEAEDSLFLPPENREQLDNKTGQLHG